MFTAFNKKYAGWMKVTFTSVPYDQKVQKIFQSLIAKSAEYTMVPIITIWAGANAPHTEDFQAWIDRFKDDPTWRINLADFPEGVIEVACKWKGRLFSVPFRAGVHSCLYYRKDLYEEKGLAPPKTLEELVNNARKLNNPPKIYGYALRGGGGTVNLSTELLNYMYSHGADVLNEDQTAPTPYPSEHTEIAEEIIKTWIQLNDEKLMPPGWLSYTGLDYVALFQQGKIAQACIFSPRALAIEDPTKSVAAGKMGYVRFLEGNPNLVGPKPGAYCVVWTLSINKYEKDEAKKETAFKLISYMTSYRSQLLSGVIWKNGPTRNDVLDDPALARMMPAAKAHKEGLKYFKGPKIPEWPQIEKVQYEEIMAAITKKKTPKEAVEGIWKRTEKILKEKK